MGHKRTGDGSEGVTAVPWRAAIAAGTAADGFRGFRLLFNSVQYGLFLVVVFIGFWALVRTRLTRMLFLLAASYFFYANWNPVFLLLIWFSSTLDWALSWAIVRTSARWKRKLFVAASVSVNLAVLGLFKYADFFLGTASDIATAWGFDPIALRLNLVLPVGISFYTFQTIGYVIDVYRGDVAPASRYHEYLTFVSFFPHLVAGPILRAKQILPQFDRPASLAESDGGRALWLIMAGLFKKVVIADFISINLVDRVFSLPEMYTSWEVLAAIYGYALQIYADFSGYSDIAIGSALLLGIHIPPNFDRPYLARNLRDFWRRWHISLSSWFRDYLYIPLGGSKNGAWRTYANLWIVMLLCGLWHGAEWKFVLWGALHGIGQTFTRIWQRALGRDAARTWVGRAITTFLTLQFVVFAWIFFRAEDLNGALNLLRVLFSFVGGAPNFAPQVAVVLLLGYLLQFVPEKVELTVRIQFQRLPASAQGLALFVLIVMLYSVASSDVVPFIYYQF